MGVLVRTLCSILLSLVLEVGSTEGLAPLLGAGGQSPPNNSVVNSLEENVSLELAKDSLYHQKWS